MSHDRVIFVAYSLNLMQACVIASKKVEILKNILIHGQGPRLFVLTLNRFEIDVEPIAIALFSL